MGVFRHTSSERHEQMLQNGRNGRRELSSP